MKNRLFLALFLLSLTALCAPRSAQAGNGKVMVSIKPLYSLVAGVMGNTGKPELIVDGLQSPHNYQLKGCRWTK